MRLRAGFALATFALGGLLAATAPAAYITGFESPYTAGELNTQDGWGGSNAPAVRVLTDSQIATELTNSGLNAGTTVHGGSQAVLVTGTSGQSSTSRSVTGLSGESRVVADLWVRPLTPPPAGTTGATVGGNVGNVFFSMEDSANVRAAAVRFGIVNGLPSIDYGTTVTGVWAPSGQAWAADTWYHLTMDANYTAKTYDLYINDARVNTSPIPFYTATSSGFDRIRLFRGSNQAGAIVDDIAISVPEPGSALVALGGIALLSIRARRR